LLSFKSKKPKRRVFIGREEATLEFQGFHFIIQTKLAMESSHPKIIKTNITPKDGKLLNPIIMRDYYREPLTKKQKDNLVYLYEKYGELDVQRVMFHGVRSLRKNEYEAHPREVNDSYYEDSEDTVEISPPFGPRPLTQFLEKRTRSTAGETPESFRQHQATTKPCETASAFIDHQILETMNEMKAIAEVWLNENQEDVCESMQLDLKFSHWEQDILALNSDYEESLADAEQPQVKEVPHSPTFEELVNRRKAKPESLKVLLSQQPTKASKVPVEDRDVVERLEDERNFVRRVRAGEMFIFDPLKVTSEQLQDFDNREGDYRPRQHLPFAGDVLVGLPENIMCSYEPLLRLGLPSDFDAGEFKLTLTDCVEDKQRKPANFQDGRKSTALGRLGGKEVTSKEPTVVSEDIIFYREFETHGRLMPLIEQSIFMKRRLDQDLTAILNKHYKDTPEDQTPRVVPFNTASEIMDKHLPMFSNQIERRNCIDQEAAVGVFIPVSRLETNVIESEIERWKAQAETMLSKRTPDLDDDKIRQLDRKKKNAADFRARQKLAKAKERALLGRM
jgi:hypothetical protein